MDEFSTELIAQLEDALRHPIRQQLLLQQREKLQEIINHGFVRRWLFEQTYQTQNSAWAKKARLLIVRILQSSNQIWRGGSSSVLPEYYEEALTRTWEWFSNNLESYDPERASFVSWFNHHLKWRIIDVQREMTQAQQRREHPFVTESGEVIDPLEIVPAPDADRWQETIHIWLELVQNDDVLHSCRMRNAPHVNGQDLLTQILQKLHELGEFSWEAIAQTYDVDPSSLKKFCRIRCFPRFRKLWAE
ncbi:MAG: hypothetical protein KME15_23725 [Drouetiella hepatica Uher 2000/2452]|jgi:hypothetical protein|uniref:Sigma-70 family RNA polymerase sigma factor n=1 Tax=Drouetiella hepatica Uher 2000/2452 TaxID=904376 RepID=A0A951QG21_9CYAN|nr:hypothetical protein [Drouetiella hepatica Uher 2000/2452]